MSRLTTKDPFGGFFFSLLPMSTDFKLAKSLMNDMLAETSARLENTMRNLIKDQIELYEQATKETFQYSLGQRDSRFNLLQHIKYQAMLKLTLSEMEHTFVKYFGKTWDYEEPVQEEPKRGRKPKAK